MNELKKLNRLNNELDKNLTKENNTIMTDMVCYIRAAGLSMMNQELIRQDLLEMALSAQERGELFSAVVGDEYKIFCDEIISNMPKMNKKERLLARIDIVLLCTSLLCLITTVISADFMHIVKGITMGETVNWNITYSLSTILIDMSIVIGAIWLVNYICKTSFESTKKSAEHQKNKGKEKKWSLKAGLIGGGIWVIMLGVVFLMEKVGANMLFSVNLFVVLVASGLMFLLHKWISANS